MQPLKGLACEAELADVTLLGALRGMLLTGVGYYTEYCTGIYPTRIIVPF